MTKLSLLAVAFCFCAHSHNSLAASKAKPEIPLGEEAYEPTPAAKKAKAEHPPSEKDKSKPDAAQSQPKEDHNASGHEAAPAKDPHAAAPANHSEDPAKAKTTGEHGEETEGHTSGVKEEAKTTLLEGKVPPATPAKGSGFVWFAVIFVVLAIAIFIFT